jgi:hypothetical protein
MKKLDKFALTDTNVSMEQLISELTRVQHEVDLLFVKNNSLDELDLAHGGGSPDDQSEYQKLVEQEQTLLRAINALQNSDKK